MSLEHLISQADTYRPRWTVVDPSAANVVPWYFVPGVRWSDAGGGSRYYFHEQQCLQFLLARDSPWLCMETLVVNFRSTLLLVHSGLSIPMIQCWQLKSHREVFWCGSLI